MKIIKTENTLFQATVAAKVLNGCQGLSFEGFLKCFQQAAPIALLGWAPKKQSDLGTFHTFAPPFFPQQKVHREMSFPNFCHRFWVSGPLVHLAKRKKKNSTGSQIAGVWWNKVKKSKSNATASKHGDNHVLLKQWKISQVTLLWASKLFKTWTFWWIHLFVLTMCSLVWTRKDCSAFSNFQSTIFDQLVVPLWKKLSQSCCIWNTHVASQSRVISWETNGAKKCHQLSSWKMEKFHNTRREMMPVPLKFGWGTNQQEHKQFAFPWLLAVTTPGCWWQQTSWSIVTKLLIDSHKGMHVCLEQCLLGLQLIRALDVLSTFKPSSYSFPQLLVFSKVNRSATLLKLCWSSPRCRS